MSNIEIPSINAEDVSGRKKKVNVKSFFEWGKFTRTSKYQNLAIGTAQITEEELANHNKDGDMWIGLYFNGRVCVFDISKFAEYHPGGFEILRDCAGRDASQDFRMAHAYVNINCIARLQVGYLVKRPNASPKFLSPHSAGSSAGPPSSSLSASFSAFKIPSIPLPKLPLSTKKLRWDWDDSQCGRVLLKLSVPRLQQGLNQICVFYKNASLLCFRIFHADDSKYSLFEIELVSELLPDLDSLRIENEASHSPLSSAASFPTSVSSLHNSDQSVPPSYSPSSSSSTSVCVLDLTYSPKLPNKERKLFSVIGSVKRDDCVAALEHDQIAVQCALARPFTSSSHYLTCRVAQRSNLPDLTRDICQFVIEWPRWSRVRLPLGHHVMLASGDAVGEESGGDTAAQPDAESETASKAGEVVRRPYTPICSLEFAEQIDRLVCGSTCASTSVSECSGETFRLAVKIYENGEMSRRLNALKIGDLLLVSLPMCNLATPHFLASSLSLSSPRPPRQTHNNTTSIAPGPSSGLEINAEDSHDATNKQAVRTTSVVFFAAGTGITPMIRILLSALHPLNINALSKIILVNCVRSHSELIWCTEFETLSSHFSSKFAYCYFVSNDKNIKQDKEDKKEGDSRKATSIINSKISVPTLKRCLESYGIRVDQNCWNCHFYFCGPIGFNNTIKKILTNWNVDLNRQIEFK